MTIFKSAKVTELEARVAELEAENANLAETAKSTDERNQELAGANERIIELETANAEIPALNATIAEHLATIASKDAEIADLKSKAQVTEEKINLAAAQKLAAQGHGEPLEITGNFSEGKAGKTMTLEAFNKLDHLAKNAFMRKGGNLTN